MAVELSTVTYDDGDDGIMSPYRGWPCVIYVRISKGDERQLKLSRRKNLTHDQVIAALRHKVDEHLEDCRDFADQIGLAVRAEFSELGSASIFRGNKKLAERDRLEAFLAARTGRMVVLTTEVARLYRDVGEGLNLVELAKKAPGLVVLDTNNRPFNLSDGDADDFIDELNSAARESRVDSHRRRRKERRRAKAGGHWGPRPFGYDLVRDEDNVPTGAMTVIKREAAVIRDGADCLIRQAAARPGESPSAAAVAREWNRRQVRTTLGNEWTSAGVVGILTDRRYLGLRVRRGAAGRAAGGRLDGLRRGLVAPQRRPV
jgi:DNA invertase Pin-like site-specific DNA recombinase